MLHRTQIALEPELQRKARKRAAELGVSLAEYVRKLLARELTGPEPITDPSILFNLGNSGGSDVARDKDRLLGEAVESRRIGRSRRAG